MLAWISECGIQPSFLLLSALMILARISGAFVLTYMMLMGLISFPPHPPPTAPSSSAPPPSPPPASSSDAAASGSDAMCASHAGELAR